MAEDVKDSACQGACVKSCGPVEIPTADEKEALDALRHIKSRVREVKRRLEQISKEASGDNDGESIALEKELEALRIDWKAWEKRRDEAAKERMILLGHEDAP